MAVILFSGGMDSLVAAALTIQRRPKPRHCLLAIDYGQRNARELEFAARNHIALHRRYPGTPLDFRVVQCPVFAEARSASAMLARNADRPLVYRRGRLPTSFLPGRNAVFGTMAVAFAAAQGHDEVIVGSNADDAAIPDSCPEFWAGLGRAVSTGLPDAPKFVAPLRNHTKAQVYALAEDAGLLDVVRTSTLTCHDDSATEHAWGLGCGVCGVCRRRAEAYAQFVRWTKAPKGERRDLLRRGR